MTALEQTQETHPALWYLRTECLALACEGHRLLRNFEASGKDSKCRRTLKLPGEEKFVLAEKLMEIINAQDALEFPMHVIEYSGIIDAITVPKEAMDAIIKEGIQKATDEMVEEIHHDDD